MKQAVSVTLSPENLLWLEALARRSRRKSLSETLDAILDGVRGRDATGPVSHAGMVVIDPSDPDLRGADAALRRLVSESWGGTSVALDGAPPSRRRGARKRRT